MLIHLFCTRRKDDMNPFDEDLKIGDRLTFTEELELHLDDLGIEHPFEYGDELEVIHVEDRLTYPICIADSRDRQWQAWVFRTIVERAQEVWLKAHGFVAPPTMAEYAEKFEKLSPKERIKAWEDLRQSALNEFLEAYQRHNPKNRLN
jgi:hypothetical protein